MFYVLIFVMLTSVALILGLVAMASGGNINKKYGTKLMSLRVIFQAVSLLSLLILYFMK
ncbi:HIG1 domain-containing protein [Rickettsiaceae bacterium]|nr:HIG1 domain-containing protein [Rickettsiaceae bacterium]